MENQIIEFTYKNYRNEISERKVIPIRIYFGATDYHKEPQWILKALDLDKNQERDFALLDIISFKSNGLI